MSEALMCAIVEGIFIGLLLSLPLWLIFAVARITVKTWLQSKLSLDDYLKLIWEIEP